MLIGISEMKKSQEFLQIIGGNKNSSACASDTSSMYTVEPHYSG